MNIYSPQNGARIGQEWFDFGTTKFFMKYYAYPLKIKDDNMNKMLDLCCFTCFWMVFDPESREKRAVFWSLGADSAMH